jgi:hypothetical protein
MAHAMKPRSPLTFVFWLVIVLGTALGALVPASAIAHPGHASGSSHARPAAQPSEHGARADQDEPVGAVVAASGREAADVMPCGGPACCTSGHGCCAAILVACPATGATPRDTAPPPVHAGLPAGLGASTPAEPPRPIR